MNNSKIKPILQVKEKILKHGLQKKYEELLEKNAVLQKNTMRKLKKKIINYPHYLIQ